MYNEVSGAEIAMYGMRRRSAVGALAVAFALAVTACSASDTQAANHGVTTPAATTTAASSTAAATPQPGTCDELTQADDAARAGIAKLNNGGIDPTPALLLELEAFCHSRGTVPLKDAIQQASHLLAANEATAAAAAALATTPYTFPVDVGGDYKVTGDLLLTNSVLGTNTAQATALWQSVGGSGPIPCIGQEDLPGLPVTNENTVLTFGKLTFTNDTKGFTPPDAQLRLDQTGLDQEGQSVSPLEKYALGYVVSTGAQCSFSITGLIAHFNAGQDTWGPIPVVLVLMQGRTPSQPEGPKSMPVLQILGPPFQPSTDLKLTLAR